MLAKIFLQFQYLYLIVPEPGLNCLSFLSVPYCLLVYIEGNAEADEHKNNSAQNHNNQYSWPAVYGFFCIPEECPLAVIVYSPPGEDYILAGVETDNGAGSCAVLKSQ